MSAPRILIADDNPLTLRFFAEALALCGADSVEAEDGLVAAERAAESAFDLLLFDANMPQLDGAAALARIRAQAGPSRAAPALATSADDNALLHAKLRAAGFVDVLVKPIGIDALRTVLARHVPLSRADLAHAGNELGLDDRQALAAAGGDGAIVTALRNLLAAELDALPAEFAVLDQRHDAHALRERLHRLDASAGFCGAPGLRSASSTLRAALDEPQWPSAAIASFLHSCARLRGHLTV